MGSVSEIFVRHQVMPSEELSEWDVDKDFDLNANLTREEYEKLLAWVEFYLWERHVRMDAKDQSNINRVAQTFIGVITTGTPVFYPPEDQTVLFIYMPDSIVDDVIAVFADMEQQVQEPPYWWSTDKWKRY